MDSEMLDRLELETPHMLGRSGSPMAILGDADFLALIAVARQNVALKSELAAVRKAADKLCSTSAWRKRTMPSGAIHYDVVVDSQAYRNFVSVLEADTAPSTPEIENG